MSNSYFKFKQFTIHQDRCAMKVTTDGCLFGAWIASEDKNEEQELKNVLDIGTGTGLLGLMYSQKNSHAIIDAVEIDSDAYQQAKENIGASPFSERIHVINADIKKFILTKKYDLIISNPPFYENEIISSNEKKNIAHHDSGLVLEEILDIIKANLCPDGVFYLLLPFKRNNDIRQYLKERTLFLSKITLVKQSTQHEYFRMMIKGKMNRENENETEAVKELSICDDRQQYTDKFKELLKDYYLSL
ncbi:MAG TPA: methyltransferase [Chitinophagaceae bacterium]|nr:methyltransferase [Chitinophagaceae bacterium]